jgi:hypothetical protein
MESRTVQFWLGRLLAGACRPADVLPLAREAGFPSFAELCSAALPERLPRLRIELDAIVSHVERALDGGLPFAELRAWADELHAIAFRHVIGRSRAERRRAVEALALVATAADDEIFKTRGPCAGVLREVAETLRAGAPLATVELYGRLFQGQRELHLAGRRPLLMDTGEGDELVPDVSWADVVLRPSPGRAAPEDPSTIVAFAVVTEVAASTDDPGHGVPIPGALAEARRLAPNFAFARFRPRLRRDVDGVLEFVLRTPEIGREEVAYAAKLFAIVHRIEKLTLDGERVAILRF